MQNVAQKRAAANQGLGGQARTEATIEETFADQRSKDTPGAVLAGEIEMPIRYDTDIFETPSLLSPIQEVGIRSR